MSLIVVDIAVIVTIIAMVGEVVMEIVMADTMRAELLIIIAIEAMITIVMIGTIIEATRTQTDIAAIMTMSP